MSTPVSKVYSIFLRKISDLDMAGYDDALLNDSLDGLLEMAIMRFDGYCLNKLTLTEKDDELYFDSDLTGREVDILTEYMLLNWYAPKVNDADKMRNNLNTKDFTEYSKANMLAEVEATYDKVQHRARSLMNEYLTLNGDLPTWKP